MMNQSRFYYFSPAIHALVIALLTLVFYLLINFFSANSFINISLTGVFPESGTAKVFYAKKTHDFAENIVAEIEVVGSIKEQTISANLNNRIIHKLRFDFSEALNNSSVLNKGLTTNVVSKAASTPITIQDITLNGFFQAEAAGIDLSNIRLSKGDKKSRELIINSDSPTFVIRTINTKKHAFVHYVLPLFLALGVWLLITSINWRAFPAIEDLLNNQQARNVNNLRPLDGLRGVAALTVLFEHSMSPFIGLGRAGVWLFFVLSGFLLVRSFILNPEKMRTIAGIKAYFFKRIKRVLPMFYFMVTIVFLLRGKVDTAARHYLLIQGDGHFWTVLHEQYFYMFLPIIACSVYLLFKQRYLWTILSLIALALAWYYLASPDLISIYGLGLRHTPYFYVFLMGMTAGYFYYGTYLQSELLQSLTQKWSKVLSFVALTAVLAFFFYASNLGIVEEHVHVWDFPFASAVLCAILVLMSAITDDGGIYNRLLSSSFLRLIGIVGYSFYLIHPYAIAIFVAIFEFVFEVHPSMVLPSIVTMVGSFCIALPIAMFTYSYIERPFLKSR